MPAENIDVLGGHCCYQADEYKNIEMNRESEHFRKVTMAVLTMQLNSVTIMDFVAYGGAALGILLATRAFVDGNIGLANCIFMILLSADFFLPMRRLGSYFHVAMNGMAASDKIFKFLNEDEPDEKTETVSGGDIVLKDVCFSYTEDREILHHVSITVPQNGFIGIVGESGSGKSTIASLMMGRNTIGSGSLTVDGKEINAISEQSLMKTITYIGFGSVFFKGTVRENLLLADKNADDKKLWQVLEDCQLSDFLKSENGLDTSLLENANNLSGGQKQRIGLARAFLHDAPLMLLDEPTSNLDSLNEAVILKSLKEESAGKTVVLVTHRKSTARIADEVIGMESGRVS